MSEGTLASAVAVPEQDTLRQSPEVSTKRRQSSVSEHETKRRRLSSQGNISPNARRQPHSPQSSALDRPAERRPNRQGREEDRKRGQRLFGGLLGTLSQSSTSAAQKRRADIEKRQQDKLKSQADEYDELKKRRRDRRDVIRRKEKPFYEREAMQTRHSNLIAAAHFLKTRTEPVLYYKPWQLRSDDEAIIREQVEEAEATVAREVAEFDARYPPEAFVYEKLEPILAEVAGPPVESEVQQQAKSTTEPVSEQTPAPKPEAPADAQEPKETSDKKAAEPSDENPSESSPTSTVPMSMGMDGAAGYREVHRTAHDDDGDEMLEDNEDTVIY